jgi:prepilin-type N-terminal cleavage/methylation domain-containing protein
VTAFPSRNRRTQGFSLIELLVVMAIVGILSAVLFVSSARSVRQQQLREAGTQLLADVNRARTQATQSSTATSVTLTSTAASSPKATYVTVWSPGGSVTQTLPNNVVVAPVATYTNTITYTAPYAESSVPSGVVWVLRNALGETLHIKLLGTTGKGSFSAQP